MSRCESIYQNRTPSDDPIGPARRCTLVDEHDGMHQWMRPGLAVRWPDSAAEKEASA